MKEKVVTTYVYGPCEDDSVFVIISTYGDREAPLRTWSFNLDTDLDGAITLLVSLDREGMKFIPEIDTKSEITYEVYQDCGVIIPHPRFSVWI